jgi:hypothetical protein
MRQENRSSLIKRLKDAYQGRYHPETLEEAERLIDMELKEQPIRKEKQSISEMLRETQRETTQNVEAGRTHKKRERDAR